jgi:hypothetical protein
MTVHGIHLWDALREVCIACGRTRQEIDDRWPPVKCDGDPAYREILRGSTFIREPIIPKGT